MTVTVPFSAFGVRIGFSLGGRSREPLARTVLDSSACAAIVNKARKPVARSQSNAGRYCRKPIDIMSLRLDSAYEQSFRQRNISKYKSVDFTDPATLSGAAASERSNAPEVFSVSASTSAGSGI